jgi:hypothetical protein
MIIPKDEQLNIIIGLFYAKKAYDNACPDVGMGPSNSTVLEEIISEYNLNLTEKQKKLIIR